jgi:hypothetical protein
MSGGATLEPEGSSSGTEKVAREGVRASSVFPLTDRASVVVLDFDIPDAGSVLKVNAGAEGVPVKADIVPLVLNRAMEASVTLTPPMSATMEEAFP